MTTEQILGKIKDEHGKSALRDGQSLLRLFQDYSHNQLRPQANALRTFLECNGNQRILDLCSEPTQKQQTEYHRLVQEMVRDYNMREATAADICAAFWRVVIGTEPPVSKPVPEPKQQLITFHPEAAPQSYASQEVSGESTPVKMTVIQAPLEKTDDSRMTAEEMYERGRQCYNAKGERLQCWHNAMQWFEKAAALNHVGAQVQLGQLYSCASSLGFPENPEKSAYWYRKAAEQGDGFSQRKLGSCYESGYGVAQDYSQAVYWYQKATENGDQYAQKELARMYRYCLNAPSQAVYWYRTAAERGDSQAQLDLGRCYRDGVGVEQDYDQAVYWCRKAAEQNYFIAMGELRYLYGYRLNQPEKAVYWCRRAAEQGYAEEQWRLGQMYEQGFGVAKDDSQAVFWYRKAAEKAPIAMDALSRCYREGIGTAKDPVQADYWQRKAQAHGYSPKAVQSSANTNAVVRRRD